MVARHALQLRHRSTRGTQMFGVGAALSAEGVRVVVAPVAGPVVDVVAAFAAGIENPIVANGIQAAVRLSMPGAQVARVVSGKLGDGAEALSRVAAGKPATPARVVKTAEPPVVRARRTVARKTRPIKAAASRTVAAARKSAVATKAAVARTTH